MVTVAVHLGLEYKTSKAAGRRHIMIIHVQELQVRVSIGTVPHVQVSEINSVLLSME